MVGTRALVSAPLFTLPASRRRSPEPAAGTARLAPSRSGEGGQQALYRAVDPRRVGKHRLRLPYPSGPAEKPLQLPTPLKCSNWTKQFVVESCHIPHHRWLNTERTN